MAPLIRGLGPKRNLESALTAETILSFGHDHTAVYPAPSTPFVRKSPHGQAFAEVPMNPDPTLFNKDLAPVPASQRTLGMYNYVPLWVAVSVCIPTHMHP